jgi:hypothetical protein
MKYSMFVLVLCLLSHIGLAQRDLKATQFIDELVATKNAEKASFIMRLTRDKSAAAQISAVRSDWFYQDSINKEAIATMHEGLNRNKNVFRGVKQDSVVYIDSIGKRTVLSRDYADELAFKNLSQLKNIRFRMELIAADSLIITDKERLYIAAEIDKMSGYAWPKDQFLNLHFIPADTLKSIFANRKRNGWDEMRKRGVGQIFSFSVPIFLRNNTYCFFYYDYGCGWLCGEGKFAVYKRINKKWVLWTTLAEWVS